MFFALSPLIVISLLELDAAGRARFDVEVLLRRAGLLVCDRSYASYSGLTVIVDSKPNVNRAQLCGAAHGAPLKILKEYSVGEFKRIKRAVAMGFTDERAMRRALGEVGGDVVAAVGLL